MASAASSADRPGEVPEGEGPLVAGAERVERLDHLADLVVLFDGIEVVFHRVVGEDVQAPLAPLTARAALPAVMVDQLVGGDAEQPGAEPGPVGVEPVEVAQRPFEGRRGDIFGRFGRPGAAVGERVDALHIPAVQHPEGGRIVASQDDQRPLIERVRRLGRRELVWLRGPHAQSVWPVARTPVEHPSRAGRGR